MKEFSQSSNHGNSAPVLTTDGKSMTFRGMTFNRGNDGVYRAKAVRRAAPVKPTRSNGGRNANQRLKLELEIEAGR